MAVKKASNKKTTAKKTVASKIIKKKASPKKSTKTKITSVANNKSKIAPYKAKKNEKYMSAAMKKHLII